MAPTLIILEDFAGDVKQVSKGVLKGLASFATLATTDTPMSTNFSAATLNVSAFAACPKKQPSSHLPANKSLRQTVNQFEGFELLIV